MSWLLQNTSPEWHRHFCLKTSQPSKLSDFCGIDISALLGSLNESTVTRVLILRVKWASQSLWCKEVTHNGGMERFNLTLGGMICALPPEAKADWPRRFQTLSFTYNCMIHEATGYSPFYLMFGQTPCLSIDVLFRNVLCDSHVTSYDRYASSFSEDLKEAMVIAQTHATKEKDHHAWFYNRRVKGSQSTPGQKKRVGQIEACWYMDINHLYCGGYKSRDKTCDKWFTEIS